MYKEQKYNDQAVRETTKPVSSHIQRPQRISLWVDHIESVNGLHIISAFMQIVLGLSVVALSLVNMIEPLWLATFMAVLGSITTMVGCYLLYEAVPKSNGFESLIHTAVKRVVNNQN